MKPGSESAPIESDSDYSDDDYFAAGLAARFATLGVVRVRGHGGIMRTDYPTPEPVSTSARRRQLNKLGARDRLIELGRHKRARREQEKSAGSRLGKLLSRLR